MTDERRAGPGWYPDPSGRTDEWRYWDGRSWSTEIRTAGGRAGTGPRSHRGSVSAWLIGAGFVLAVIVVGVLIVVRAGARPPATSTHPPNPPAPAPRTSGIAAGELCTEPSAAPVQQVPTVNGRVTSGHLSYSALATPFATPTRTTLMRFGYLRDVASQFATLRFRGSSTGGAEVMIARLPMIDGLSHLSQIGEVLFGCVQDRFPGAEERGRAIHSTSVSAHPAWVIRTHLGYGAATAGVRGGVIIVCVIATTDGENGLFYAYLPDTHPELVVRGDASLAGLTVS